MTMTSVFAAESRENRPLMERAQARDAAAFAELYQEYAPRIASYLARRLGGRTSEVEDLTADVFAKVFEKLDQYQDRGVPFAAWLFRIARNQLIDHLRALPRQPMVGIDAALDVREPGSFQALDRHLAADQIRDGMQRLTDEQRRVIGLRFVEGRTTAQTAHSLAKSEEAVKKLQSRALASLKRGMDCQSGCWRVDLNLEMSR